MSHDPNHTVVDNIYALLQEIIDGNEIEVDEEAIKHLGEAIAEKVKGTLTPRTKARKDKTLYMSEVGRPCQRQIWYDINVPVEYKEQLLPHNLIKFLYGDILEEILLFLVRQAGHKVTDEQGVIEIPIGSSGWVVRGRMDAVIDGTVCDVKSASSYAFKKFSEGTLPEDDPFGYMAQLGGYDKVFSGKEVPYFLAIDKQNGTLVTYTPTEAQLEEGWPDVEELAITLEMPFEPNRTITDKPFGKSGNRCLEIGCSYCSWKHTCWKDANKGAGLRTFIYNGKPVHFTEITREPRVPEVQYEMDTSESS